MTNFTLIASIRIIVCFFISFGILILIPVDTVASTVSDQGSKGQAKMINSTVCYTSHSPEAEALMKEGKKTNLHQLQYVHQMSMDMFVACTAGQTGGKVWQDFDNDGVKDAGETVGVMGVTVTAFDTSGMVVATTMTDANGQYTFGVLAPAPSASRPIRVEFSAWPSTYAPTFNGTDGRTDVQFITAAECNVDFGLVNPEDYCQPNPLVAVACYVNGLRTSNGPTDVIVAFDYNATNTSNPSGKIAVATKSQIGSVWGMSYSKKRNSIYSATFLKRNIDLGPSGLGAVYRSTVGGGANGTLFVNIPNVGTTPGSRGLGTYTAPSQDAEAFPLIGKVGLGDIDISADENTLYVVNLNTKKLIIIDINLASITDSIAIPDPGCTNGVFRPFGVKFKSGKVYVGGLCDGSVDGTSGDSNANMSAYVYVMDAITKTFNPTAVLSFPLTYKKDYAWGMIPANSTSTKWHPWDDIYSGDFSSFNIDTRRAISHPVPMLTDIDFTSDNRMILGFADRTGHQFNDQNRLPTATTLVALISGGDILIANPSGATWTIESLSTTTAMEFFTGEKIGTAHLETSHGGLAVNQSLNETVITAMDPLNFTSGGVDYLSNSTGAQSKLGVQLYSGNAGSTGYSGKGVGLGDIELLCAQLSVQIGNFVWSDKDHNGIQDAGEPGIPGVIVELYNLNGVLVGKDTTNSQGEYYFDQTNVDTIAPYGTGGYTGLTPGAQYYIVIGKPTAQFDPMTNFFTANQQKFILTGTDASTIGAVDQNDNDGALLSGLTGGLTMLNGYPGKLVVAPTAGANHTFDFGFFPLPCEIVISSINLSGCYDSNGNTAGGSSVADLSISVTWDNRPSGDSILVTVPGGTPGTKKIIPAGISGSGTVSFQIPANGSPITLNAKFINNITCFDDSLITTPTGPCLNTPCPGGNSTGGSVWVDFNNNGIQETSEIQGVSSVTVQAYDCNGNLVGTATPDALGQYFFTPEIPLGSYPIRVEFSGWSSPYVPSFNGVDGRTDVQIIAAPDCNVDFGLVNPDIYCEQNPLFAVVCFTRNNDPNTDQTIIFMDNNRTRAFTPANATDANKDWATPSGANAGTYPIPVYYEGSNKGEVGTTFGLAWDKYSKKLFSGAYMRAYSPMNANASANGFGEGVIFQIPINNTTASAPSVWLDLETLFGDGIAGTYIADAAYPGPLVFGKTGSNPNKIGFTGLGSMAISSDGTEMYVVNLNTQEVFVIPIGANGSAPTMSSQIKRFPVPDAECPGNWPDGRPYRSSLGLGIHPQTGRVYVSATCTGPALTDLKGIVYSFDPSDNTPSTSDFTKELEIPLNIAIPATNPNVAYWYSQVVHPWESVNANVEFYANNDFSGNTTLKQHTHPWLGEIGFALQPNGVYSMIVGQRNRYHDLINSSFYVTGGEMFKACNAGSDAAPVWSLENNKVCGAETSIVNWTFSPATRAGANTSVTNRFFKTVGREGTFGAGTLEIVPGTGEVIMPTMDNVFNSGTSGIGWLSTSTGDRIKDNRILGDFTNAGYSANNFTKANNWADIVALCTPLPIQIGNKLWLDSDADGIQDPCEPPLAWVVVELYDKNGVLVGRDTTDNNGEYYFDQTNVDTIDFAGTPSTGFTGMTPNQQYYVVIGGASGQFNTTTNVLSADGIRTKLTLTNTGEGTNPDQNDNDGTILSGLTGGLTAINGFPGSIVTTPTQGADHTFDYGFAPECMISIQNIVVSCSTDTVFTVSFNAGWINPNFATVGPINIYINGVMAANIPTLVRADTVQVGPFAVHGPAYAIPIRIQFSGDTSCNAISSVDLIACGAPCSASPTSTGGTVFQDYNNNGSDTITEPGQENVFVQLYDCDGNLVCQTYTNANGEWTCTGLTAGDQYRVEFSTPLQPWLQPSFAGTNNKSNIQFIVPGTCTVDYGVIDPSDYCQFNPRWVTGCYVNGLANLTDAAFISQNYNASGFAGGTPYIKVGTTDDIGSTWGIGYNKNTKRVFTSSYLKRHVGLADGPGFVYYFNFSGVTPTVPEGKFDLQGIMPANGGPAIDLGSLCRQSATDGDPNVTCLPLGGAAADYTLGAKGAQNRDLDAFAKVGAMSFGDADVDPKTGKLWLTNLFQKALISVDVSGIIPGAVNQYLLTDIPGLPNCPGGNIRPFALAFHQGLGYIGVICDASLSQSISDLHAYVLSFNPANPMAGLSNVLDFNLGYKLINQLSGRTWNPWISTNAQLPGGVPLHPQPILSDIEFGPDNSMIVGLRDRWGDMAAVGNLIPALGGGTFANSISTGDILKACFNNGVWIMEGFPGGCPVTATSGGTGVNANGEFFKDTRADTWDEGSEGGLALIPGTGEVVTTFTDPWNGVGAPPNASPYLDGQGLQFFSTSTGSITDFYQVYHQQFPLFGKGAGLSDIQFICTPPPIQIGNYVWQDIDEDGVQDPCEPPVPNLFVTLLKKNVDGTKTVIAVDTTDANGNYYFNNVLQDSSYALIYGYNGLSMTSQYNPTTGVLIIGTDQYLLTSPNSSMEGSTDLNDSDADTMTMAGLVGPYPTIMVTPTQTDHTLDVGLIKRDIHDVALKKVLVMPTSGIQVGSNITFGIWVYNQGTANLDSVVVTDYIPSGYTYSGGSNPGWVGSAPLITYSLHGASSPVMFASGGLMPGDSIMIPIVLTVAPGASPSNTVNNAEISYSRDVAGLTGAEDKDSTPDQNPDNDAGADSSSAYTPADNYINGNGTGMVDDGVDSTDEDDADPAGIPIFDLALTKTIDPVALAAAGGLFSTGDTVVFNIKVYNQGNVDAFNVVIKDTIPCGLNFNAFASPGWVKNADSSSAIYIIPMVPVDSCVIVPIAMVVKSSVQALTDCALDPRVVPGKPFQNYAFIVSAQDTSGATVTADFDSPYNTFTPNEIATNPNVPGDNDVASMTDGALGSQDDNDPANLDVFDLALSKVLVTPLPPGGYAPGDIVTFRICVYNQGNIRVDTVAISDYIPDGFTFSNAYPNNSNWSESGGIASYTIGANEISGNDTLEFGDSVCINLDLKIVAGATNYVNEAEISGAIALIPDTSATPTPGLFLSIPQVQDNDSKFDSNPANNGGGCPNKGSDALTSSPTDPAILGNGTGMPGDTAATTDQDNADIALVPIVDFALRKTIVAGQAPFRVGDTVLFDIKVFNQGSITGANIIVNDYVPSHLKFVGVLNPGWTGVDGSAVTVTSPSLAGPLSPLDSLSTQIKLIILPGGPSDTSYTNHAEINSVDGIAGEAFGANPIGQYDYDSSPDNNPFNDNGADASSADTPADNAVNGTGTFGGGAPDDGMAATDEDDADPALVPIHDVALIKLRVGSGTVDIGQTVTFEIRVFNQGNSPLDSLKITDYIPSGYSFMPNNGWTAAGMNACLDTLLAPADQVAPLDSISFFIDLTVIAGANASNLTNVAEITSSRDINGLTEADDPDSQPDGPLSGGGALNTPSDNSVNGNGTGAPGDPTAALDDDGSDPANVVLTQYSIGNLVWVDANNDGIHQPTEDTIQGVVLELHLVTPTGCILVATDTTDVNGKYLFDTLSSGQYIVVIAGSNFAPGGPLYGYVSSSGNQADLTMGPYENTANPIDADNNIDNDDNGYLAPASHPLFAGLVISDTLTLSNQSEPINESDSTYDQSGALNANSNLTLDFGFTPIYSLGNLVWVDNNNNGLYDGGETGGQGVAVVLHLVTTSGCVAVDTLYTDSNGNYLFDSLAAGDYIVEIPAFNFASGGALQKYVSSNGEGTDLTSTTGTVYEDPANPVDPNLGADNGIDFDDNGVTNLNATFPVGSLASDTVHLGTDAFSEPLTETDSDNSGATNARSNLTIDFSVVPLHSLGNQIFADGNNNGKMDPGEIGIPGVKVILHYVDTTGGMSVCVILDSVITDFNGNYVFDSLPAGQYIVEIPASNFGPMGALGSYVSSTGSGPNTASGPNEVPGMPIDADTPADSTDHGVLVTNMASAFFGSVISDTLHLGEDEPIGEPNDTTAIDMNSNLTIDFGFIPQYSLGNQVWVDGNNNGIKDIGEAPLPGVIVDLHYYNPVSMQCELVGSDTTDANGLYLFDGLIGGQYILALGPDNYAFGGPLIGYISSTGGGLDLATKTGSSYDDPGSLGSMVALSDPENNINNDDNGVTNLYTSGPLVGLIATDTILLGNGEPLNDTFPNNDPGTPNLNSNLSIDFGVVPLYSLGNLVWIDANNNGIVDQTEMGVKDVEVVLHYVDPAGGCVAVDTVLTDANGKYLFDTLIAGNYIIEITAANFNTGNPLAQYVSSNGAGVDLTSTTGTTYEDPANPFDPNGITGPDNDDNGVTNLNSTFPLGSVASDTIRLGDGSEPTNEFDVIQGMTEADLFFDQSGASNINNNLTIDFSFVPLHSLGDQIFVDANNNGRMDPGEGVIPGVLVVLHYYNADSMKCFTIDSVFTDGNGNYIFDSLIAGPYIVEIPASNFAPGGPLAPYTSSTGGGLNTNPGGPYEVPGMPIDADTPADSTDHGVAGTGMFLGGIVSDTLHLGEDEPTGEPNDTTALDMNSNLTIDFGFMPLHSIGNLVWADVNNNGLLDPGEMGIDSVLVILHAYDPLSMTCIAIDSVYTNPLGGYLFDTLIAGTYLVEIDQSNLDPGGKLQGYASSTGSNGSSTGPYEDGMTMPDVNAVNSDDDGNALITGGVWSDSIKLAENEPLSAIDSAGLKDSSGALDASSNLTIDFGFYPMHSIGNTVWTDVNNNGIIDPIETGIQDVLVILHYFNGVTCVAIDSQYTDPMGGYLFDSLVAGKYLVEIAAINFTVGMPLELYASSTGTGAIDPSAGPYEMAPDPDTNIDSDDNGTMNGNLMFPGAVFSDTLDLNGNEPIGPADTAGLDDNSGAFDIMSNLTVDFGFFPLHSIGNQLFVDANNNGIMDPGEGVLPGVKVVLHYYNADSMKCFTIDSVLTDADGKYVFDSLIAGPYLIEIPASNFAPGGPLENFISSTGGGDNTSTGPNELTGMPIDADTPADSSDHGVYVPVGSPMFGGGIISDTLHLGENEPVGEPNDTTARDALSNLHIDFGFMEIFSLGNMVWADRDNDGQVDPDEQVIGGVVMELHKVIDTVDEEDFPITICRLIGYDTTDGNGLYVFDSLLMGRYIVAISASNYLPGGALFGGFASSTGDGNTFNPTTGPYEDQNNPNWANDSTDNNDNGSLMAGTPDGMSVAGLIASDTINLGFKPSEPLAEDPYNDTTVTDDHNNLTIDFGLVPLNSIGNQVWWDANNNGVFDRATEVTIDSVEVVLHWYNDRAGVCVAQDTVLTDATGRYLFAYLLEGKYIIEITAKNFLPGGPLAGFASSTAGNDLTAGPYEGGDPTLTDGDRDLDDVDHGITNLNSTFPSGSVASDTITLTSGKEPFNEFDPEYDTTGAPYSPGNTLMHNTPDSNSNLTIDFGFVPLHSIGNQVFLDFENNGVFDPAIDEAPFGPVKVVLHYVGRNTANTADSCIALDTTYTDVDGYYLFDSLNAGKYIVEITPDNFDPGGNLEGFFSSTNNPNDIESGPYENPGAPSSNTDIDGDDNGVKDRYPGFPPGAILTDTVMISDFAEPDVATETSVPSNDHSGALDQNSNLTIDFGFLVPCKELTCIAKVNISMDENCQHCLSAKDVLKAKYLLPDKFYIIEVFAGNIKLPSNCIGREWLGYTLTYKITSKYPCDVNSCWGTLVVEDKLGAALNCRPDTITCFEFASLPTGSYMVKDNCGDSSKVVIASEVYTDYGCDSATLLGKVTRKLVASDQWGNSNSCTKEYFIAKISIDSVVCPRDTSVDCSIATVDLTINGVKKQVRITDPIRSKAPMVKTIKGLKPLWPNSSTCKLTVGKQDDSLVICGGGYKILRTWIITDWCTGRDTICKQTIAVEDKTAPIARDTVLATKAADPHDCRALFDLKKLPVTDCSEVTQSYSYPYLDEATGATRIANGSLPASVWVGNGRTEITVTLTDGCNNITTRKIVVNVIDITPPTPVCVEYTQVTVDPASCWAAVAAKDLNSGSRDNCISQLHYAAALMSDIEKARTDYTKRITDSCGKDEYWNNKAWYDAYIEQWINCYVFTDTVNFNDCGSNQVVMRVYEADSMPRLDPHLWTCGEHAWFCYNTYPQYRTIHNLSFFGDDTKNCKATAPWLCKSANAAWYADSKRTLYAVNFYYGANAGANFPQTHLYNDCMVQVLVDDKQAPVVAGLEDITLYCDGAPAGSAYARLFCESSESYSPWPGTIKDSKGTIHGYYGGSTYIVNHTPGNDHADPTGCPTDQWSPIYCRKWLLLDSFDQAGQINPKDYFDQLVKFDKNRPSRALKGNEFSITDNCKLDDGSLKVTDAGSLNGCGEGWIQRTWTMTDKCGNPVTAIQKIIVKHRSDFEVIFPADIEVSCEASDAVDTSHTGIPVISDDDCEQVGVRYEDEISTVTDGACYKIVRTWTLIDWCIYDPNAHTIHPDVIVDDRLRANQTDRACIMRNIKDNGDGYVKYVQIIKVTDHQAPVVTCKDSTLCITNGCTANVNIPLNGTDNCAEKVLFRVDITRPDNSTETRVDVSAITGSFTAGVYKVRIIGRDHCGNEDTCQMNLTIKDCKAPTPYCLNGVATVVMPSTGSIQIWAKDLDRASEDNCTPQDKLKFSFSKNTADASRVLSCSDILNGREQAIELSIWVTDEAGNADFCKTYILLQDNGGTPGGVCKDTTVAFSNVTGRLYTEDQEGVEFATVEVKGQTSAGIPSFKTASDGSYLFSSLPMSGIQSIKALRDDNPMNGVSTLDLVLIQKHILGTEKLKSAYKMIAADVDNNNDISVIDLIELRKLILGLYDKLPNNTSWKFVPKSHTFTDVENPWGYPTEDKLVEMKEQMTRDFVGVKIGDVNSSALAHSLMGTEIRGAETGLIFEVQDKLYRKGERVEVQFTSPNFKGVSGFQGTMSIGEKQLRMDNIDAGSIKVNESNIGRRWATEGLITMSWNGAQSVDLTDQEVLFTMVFTAQADGRLSEVLRIGSQRTKAESYEGKGELGNVSIRFIGQNGQEVTGRSTLYQNYPNPFDQRTVIGLNLADSGRGTLKITDITGRTIKVIEKDWSKGYHEVWMDRRDIQATGVLYYSFESNSFKAVRKMVLLE